jgi:hypothetical protein
MNEWTIKTFHKKEAIRATVAYPDKRVRLHWAIPNGSTVQIGKNTFTINEKDVMIQNGIPAYMFLVGRPEPLNPYAVTQSYMTSEDFDVAISAKVAREILEVTSGKFEPGLVGLLVSGLAVIASIGVGYWLSTFLTDILERVIEIERIIKLIGGF